MKKVLFIVYLTLASCAYMKKGNTMKNLNTDFDKKWNYSDPVATRASFQSYLNQSDDLDYELQLKTQIARTYSLKAEFNEAHKLLDEVEATLSETTPIAKVRYLLERGRTYNSANEKTKAKEIFINAYEASKSLGLDKFAIDAAHMVAIAAKDLDQKLSWTEKGIKAAQATNDEKLKGWVGVFLNNSGWDLFEAKRLNEALNMFKRCEEFHKSAGNKKNQDIAQWSIAKTYRYLGELEKSLKIQESLLSENNGIDESGYTYEELAELYLLMEKKEKEGKRVPLDSITFNYNDAIAISGARYFSVTTEITLKEFKAIFVE